MEILFNVRPTLPSKNKIVPDLSEHDCTCVLFVEPLDSNSIGSPDRPVQNVSSVVQQQSPGPRQRRLKKPIPEPNRAGLAVRSSRSHRSGRALPVEQPHHQVHASRATPAPRTHRD
jgi:hypothetical protein